MFFCCELDRWTFEMCESQNRSNMLLVSGAHEFRLMRFVDRFMSKWILNDKFATIVQIDGPEPHTHTHTHTHIYIYIYIQYRENGRRQDVLHSTGRQDAYRHNNGEISTVRISTAGMGTRRVRIAKLPPPPEMSDGVYGWFFLCTV
jgi:hypothetical protein